MGSAGSVLAAEDAASGEDAGARRGAGRVVRRRGDARRAVRFTARRAAFRDRPFLRDAFMLLPLRDFAFIFAFLRRFFAMRAPSKCARVF
jgi:hypothetical protein